jgi:hypothetical protein
MTRLNHQKHAAFVHQARLAAAGFPMRHAYYPNKHRLPSSIIRANRVAIERFMRASNIDGIKRHKRGVLDGL